MKVKYMLLMFCSMIIGAIFLSSCATVPTEDQIDTADYGSYPSNYQTAIMNSMNAILFDPYSAVYRFGTPYKGYAYVNGSLKPPVFGYLVNVGINAKNRMGGYVGEKPHTFFFKDDSLWNLQSFVTRGRIKGASVDKTLIEKPPKEISIDNNSIQKIEGAIMQLSGSGIKNTRPFDVNGPWEIWWNAKGSFFAIAIYSVDGSLVGVAANQQGPGKGSSYQPKSGRYYLGINGIGDWQVHVIEEK